jgi:hypothetical protein
MNVKRWNEAMQIAALAMGKEEIKGLRGNPRHTVWRADEDPLAWWILVELIYAYGQRK